MDALNFDILLRILLAHFLSDFIFQPTKWAEYKDKKGLKSWHLYIHIIITATTLFILLWDWNLLYLVLILSFLHFVIDTFKSFIKWTSFWIFITDQILHLIAIVFVWLVFTKQFDQFAEFAFFVFNNHKFWLFLLAYIVLTIPTSILIGKMTNKWNCEVEITDQNDKLPQMSGNNKGLENGGKWIGIIERILILTFILVNQLSVIGFLLAAKSVFRFGDLKDSSDQKRTEYIIIGTFISFSLAIFVGLIVKFVLNII